MNDVRNVSSMTNGPGAAAVLAAGVGMFVLGALSFVGDKSAAIKNSLVWYKPTGALSGVSCAAVLAWVVVWAVLDRMWRRKTVAMGRVNAIAFGLLGLGLLLVFPPLVDRL
jgi:hypothetical protein